MSSYIPKPARKSRSFAIYLRKWVLPLISLFLFTGFECRADVKFVDFFKIDPSGQYISQQKFLKDNLVYYDHWSPDWTYDIPKDSLIRGLKDCLLLFAPLKADVFETDLLLGEIAHYLYNLNLQPYFDTAEAYYLKAIAADDKDCRGYWFLGYHYALSDELVKGVLWFGKAEKRVNGDTGNEFWQEYAFAMMLGGMFSHCRYGLDNFKRLGGSSTLAKVMDSTLRAKTIQTDPDLSYSAKALWQTERMGAKVSFTSRPLGLKFQADSNWRMQVNGFGKRLTAVSIEPPVVTSARGARIGYSFAVVVRAASEGEKLEDFMVSMMKIKGAKDGVFPFSDRYPGGLSYTLKDKNLYTDRGGARIHYIGIERSSPANPGLALEDQAEEIKSESGKLEFHTLNIIRTRFPDRIFYLLILDTCEDIYEQSWNTFRGFVKNMRLD